MDDSTATDCESETGDCQPLIRCAYWFLLQLFDCSPNHLAIADHQKAQLCGCGHSTILLKHVWGKPRRQSCKQFSRFYMSVCVRACEHACIRCACVCTIIIRFLQEWGMVNEKSLQASNAASGVFTDDTSVWHPSINAAWWRRKMLLIISHIRWQM